MDKESWKTEVSVLGLYLPHIHMHQSSHAENTEPPQGMQLQVHLLFLVQNLGLPSDVYFSPADLKVDLQGPTVHYLIHELHYHTS